MRYTFVTVAHREDEAWLRLQARSMARYLRCDLVEAILIVDNSRPPAHVDWTRPLATDLGGLSPRVRVIKAADLVAIPPWVSGWTAQQVLKLAAAQLVETPRYVVLDAKNHLVFTLEETFLAAGGRMRSRLMNFEQHPMRPYLETTLRYFDLDPVNHIQSFTPVTTPFVLDTMEVRALTAAIAVREHTSFERAFIARGLNEFFLVSSFLLASGRRIEELYDLSSTACPTIWPESAARGTPEVHRLIDSGEANQLPFFGVHRRAVPALSAESAKLIADYWQRRGLFATSEDGVAFIGARGRGSLAGTA